MRSCRSGVNRRRLMVIAAPALLAIPNYLHAQSLFTATPTGDWNVAANWSTGVVPGSANNVQINANNEADILGGENVSAKTMTIGTGASNLGTVTLAANSTLNLTSATLANSAIGSLTNGAGTLIVSGGQILGTNEGFNVGGNSSGAAGTILMNSGTINLTSTGVITYALALGVTTGSGTLIQNGGTIVLSSLGTFGLGRGSAGYYDMEGGTLNVGGIFQMASGSGGAPNGIGTFIQNAGTVSANLVTFAANGNATCNLSGGTLISATGLNLSNNAVCTTTVTQTNNEFVSAGSVDIGVGSTTGGAAVATYTMNSGTLTVGTTMIVGGSSTTLAIGTFNQTGGYLQAKTLILGAGTGSTGVANISGTGSVQLGVVTVNPASTLQVGTSGSGTFNLCSLASGTSTLSVGTIQVGSVSSSATTEVDSQFLMGNATDPNSLPAVTAGTIDFGQTDNSPLTSRLFSMASGTLTAGLVDLTSYDGGRTAQNQATFQQLGGTATIGSMTFAGGVYQVGGASTAPTVVNNAAITVNPQGMGVLPSGVTTTYAGGGTIACAGTLTMNGAMVNNGAELDLGAAANANGTITFRGAQTNAAGSIVKVVSGQLNMQTDAGLVGGVANLTLAVSDHAVIGGGTFVNATENLGTLSILGGGVVRLNSSGPGAMPNILLHTGTLSIKNDALPTGTLDMAADDAIVDNGVFATIQAQVKSGYAGGTWAGPGIRSSQAAAKPAGLSGIGYASVSQIGTTTFDGVDLSAEPSAVVLKYTLLGDANLDGTVNALDFNALANNYGTGGKTWADGDFNYSADGTVDSNDFALLAANFNNNVAASGADVPDAAPMALGSVVPEPTSLSLIALSSLALKRRRRNV